MHPAVSQILACPECGEDVRPAGSHSYTCSGCGRISRPAGDGYLDMLQAPGEPDPAAPTLGQRMMESQAFVSLYEKVMRPFFARLFAGPGAHVPTPQEEFGLYRQWLPLEGSSGTVCDLSCGSGFFTDMMARLAPDALVVGVDISQAMLNQAAERVRLPNVAWVRGDVRALPFKDTSFDTVNNPGSLHLYADPVAAYREVFRVLKPGGYYSGSTFAESDRALSRHAARLLGVRRTDLPGLPDTLKQVGFCDYQQRTFGDAFVFVVRKP